MKKEQVQKIFVIAVVAALVAAGLYLTVSIVKFNGNSFDFSKSEIVYETTGVMDHDGRPNIVKTDIDSIPKGSLVMIHKIAPGERMNLHVGDVVAYRAPEGVLVMRIVAIDPLHDLVTIGGDTGSTFETMSLNGVYGKVVGSSVEMAKLFDLMHTPIPLLLLIPVGFVMVILFRGIQRQYNGEDSDKTEEDPKEDGMKETPDAAAEKDVPVNEQGGTNPSDVVAETAPVSSDGTIPQASEQPCREAGNDAEYASAAEDTEKEGAQDESKVSSAAPVSLPDAVVDADIGEAADAPVTKDAPECESEQTEVPETASEQAATDSAVSASEGAETPSETPAGTEAEDVTETDVPSSETDGAAAVSEESERCTGQNASDVSAEVSPIETVSESVSDADVSVHEESLPAETVTKDPVPAVSAAAASAAAAVLYAADYEESTAEEPYGDLNYEVSPEDIVRRAAFNRGLRCRKNYGEYRIPVAFVKPKVAVFILDAGASDLPRKELESQGWKVLSFYAVRITDGKAESKVIKDAVARSLRNAEKQKRARSRNKAKSSARRAS